MVFLSDVAVHAAPADVFDCVEGQIRRGLWLDGGYKYDVLQIDRGDRFLRAARDADEIFVSDPRFIRGRDWLQVDVFDRDSATELRIEARSYEVYFTRAGYYERERVASETARSAARLVADR